MLLLLLLLIMIMLLLLMMMMMTQAEGLQLVEGHDTTRVRRDLATRGVVSYRLVQVLDACAGASADASASASNGGTFASGSRHCDYAIKFWTGLAR